MCTACLLGLCDRTPVPATDRTSWPTADELAEMSRHDQEMWERRCAEAEEVGQ